MSIKNYFGDKRKLKWLGCFLFVLCFSVNASAQTTDNYGGEIFYQYQSGSKYRIYVVYYHRSVGILGSLGYISITDGKTTNSYTGTLCCKNCYTSGLANGQCDQCTNGTTCSFPYGVQLITYYVDVNLNYFSGCKLTISWIASSYLLSSITTGAANEPICISTTLNRCNGDQSSPQFQQQPLILVNYGKLVDQYQTVTSANKNDSIYYHLIKPLSAPGSSIPYYPSRYAYNYPLEYQGSSPGDAKPKGFHYEPNSGELDFTPEGYDVSLISLEADEYSKDTSGKWYLAGSTVRSNVIICNKFNATNNNPAFSILGRGTGDTITTCAGNEVAFTAKANDPNNPNDTLTMSGINGTGGSLSLIYGTHASASFTWTPQNADVSSRPYQVIIIATDNAPPLIDQIQTAYYILVKDSIPSVTITPIDSGCARYYFREKAQPSGGLFYQWYINNTLVSGDTSFAYTFPRNGTYIIDLHLSNALGCAWDYYDTVKISILSDVKAAGGMEICKGTSATLSAMGGLKYTWQPATGLAIDTGATVSAMPKITTRYYVSGTDANGCKAIDTAVVVVDTIGLHLNTDTTICAGQVAYVKANIIKAKSFIWVNLKGIQMSDSAAVYFKLVSDTQYLFNVTDSMGCAKTVLGEIHPDRSSIKTSQGVSVCYGDSLQLQVSGGSKYYWYPEIGLSNGSSSANPYVSPPYNQDYPVSYSDQYGCAIRDTVKVIVSKIQQFAKQQFTICKGDTARLIVSGGKSYLWSPAYNISDTHAANPVVYPDTTTTYTATVCDTFCGCVKIDSVVLTVNSIIKNSAGLSQQICEGQSATIGANSVPGYQYNWHSIPIGFISTSAKNIVSPPLTTTYTLVINDPSTTCKSTDSVKITVDTFATQISGPQSVCQGDTQAYVISSFDKSNTYTWKITGGHILASGKNNIIIIWDSIENNSITLTEELPPKCGDSNTIYINTVARPVIQISAAKNICLGSAATFVDRSPTGNSFFWQFGDGDTSNVKNPVYIYHTPGIYNVSLESSNGMCSSFDSTMVIVFNLPVRSPVISHTGFRQYLFDNNDSAGIYYTWYPGDGDTLNFSDISHTYADTGLYKIVFDYGYSWGCPQSFDTLINVTDEPVIPPPHYSDSVSVGPNPFIDDIYINFSHSKQESVQMIVYDAIGRLISEMSIDNQAPGAYNYTFQTLEMGSGIYFLKYRAGEKTTVFKMIKI